MSDDRDILKPTGQSCTNCGREHVDNYWYNYGDTWWYLHGYYGLFGSFCPECYDLVSHNSYGIPNHPKEFKSIAIKQQLQRSNRNLNV